MDFTCRINVTRAMIKLIKAAKDSLLPSVSFKYQTFNKIAECTPVPNVCAILHPKQIETLDLINFQTG